MVVGSIPTMLCVLGIPGFPGFTCSVKINGEHMRTSRLVQGATPSKLVPSKSAARREAEQASTKHIGIQ